MDDLANLDGFFDADVVLPDATDGRGALGVEHLCEVWSHYCLLNSHESIELTKTHQFEAFSSDPRPQLIWLLLYEPGGFGICDCSEGNRKAYNVQLRNLQLKST